MYADSLESYENPQGYMLCPSLQKFLFYCPRDIMEELQKVKDDNLLDFPF